MGGKWIRYNLSGFGAYRCWVTLYQAKAYKLFCSARLSQIDVLLAAKAEYKEVTGEDPPQPGKGSSKKDKKKAAAAPAAPPAAAAPPAGPAEDLLEKITAAGDRCAAYDPREERAVRRTCNHASARVYSSARTGVTKR